MKNEAILNCKDFEWSNFICLLGLFSVLKDQVLTYYHDVVDAIINIYLIVAPLQELIILNKCFRILFRGNESFGTFVKSAKFQSNHFVPLLLTIQERKKSNPSHSSSASKKVCLKLPFYRLP